MKVEVTRKCGHVETVEVFGKASEREKKIAWYESTDCADCYNADGCEEVEMLYSEYKNNYPDCKTKKDSYDKASKTIIVFVPVKEESDMEKAVKEIKEAGLPEKNIEKTIKDGSAKLESDLNAGIEKGKQLGKEINQETVKTLTTVIVILKKYNL